MYGLFLEELRVFLSEVIEVNELGESTSGVRK